MRTIVSCGTLPASTFTATSRGSVESWFLRLPYTRVIHHSYAGIVRLEVPVAGTVGPPVRVADSDTLCFPAHFRRTSAGYVKRDGDAFRYEWIDNN